MIDSMSPMLRYKIEDWDQVIPDIMERFDVPKGFMVHIPKNINTRRHWDSVEYGTLIWDDLYPEVREMAENYGYTEEVYDSSKERCMVETVAH